MELLENYNKSLKAIFDHVGYKYGDESDGINDYTDEFWDFDTESVSYADTEKEFEEEDGNYYVSDIYNEHIYVGELITLIICNSDFDNTRINCIFDNSKRIKS